MFSLFTTLRHSGTRRLHASWQSNGTVAGGVDPGWVKALVWSNAGSNFSLGNFVDAIAPVRSRFHRIVLRHPPSDRQKFATTSMICASDIFAAIRYIPVWRSNVSRNAVVPRRPSFRALNVASRPG